MRVAMMMVVVMVVMARTRFGLNAKKQQGRYRNNSFPHWGGFLL